MFVFDIYSNFFGFVFKDLDLDIIGIDLGVFSFLNFYGISTLKWNLIGSIGSCNGLIL